MLPCHDAAARSWFKWGEHLVDISNLLRLIWRNQNAAKWDRQPKIIYSIKRFHFNASINFEPLRSRMDFEIQTFEVNRIASERIMAL